MTLALLVFGLLDSAQLYLFEHFRGEPVSVVEALARNFTLWLALLPFAWGLHRWLSKPVKGSTSRRLLFHAAVAFGAGLVHIALWDGDGVRIRPTATVIPVPGWTPRIGARGPGSAGGERE